MKPHLDLRRSKPDVDETIQEPSSPALRMGAFSCLSIDLERLVLSYIPIRPRLLVLSYVCKRWRRLVLESVEILPPRRYAIAPPKDLLPLVRLIHLCPNIRELPLWVSEWPIVPHVPKLDYFALLSDPTDAEIWLLIQSYSRLASLCVYLAALPELSSEGITLYSFPKLEMLSVFGYFSDAVSELKQLSPSSLPSLRELICSALSDGQGLLLLQPHFSKLRSLTFCSWVEADGFLDFILSDASSFHQLTHLAVLQSRGVPYVDLDTAQRLLRTCTSLKRLHLCRGIDIETDAQRLLAPYMYYFCDRDIDCLDLATPDLDSKLELMCTNIVNYPHVLPFLSRMAKLTLGYAPGLDLSSAVGVTEVHIWLTRPVVMPQVCVCHSLLSRSLPALSAGRMPYSLSLSGR